MRHALAGIQAGVLGALAMFACLIVGSLWNHRSVWLVPNLFATTFFGADAYRNQLVRTTWAGLALMVAVYGVLGMGWGLIVRDRRISWLALYGIITGLLVYFVFYDFLWKHINPLVTLYAPDQQLQLGHALWGLALARSPGYSRRISASIYGVPEAKSHSPELPEAVQEVSSGEVIR
jgi:hypothetical protein